MSRLHRSATHEAPPAPDGSHRSAVQAALPPVRGRRIRVSTILLAAMVGLWVWPEPALAHGDQRLVAGTFDLDAGATVVFDGELHYHRLVGRFVAAEPVVVRLVDSATGGVAVTAGPGREVRVNQLVRCCEERTWSPYRLEIENVGRQSTRVAADATLVHDDLAVMVYGAESGTSESVVVLGGIWVWVAWRIHRRRLVTPGRRAGMTTAILVAAVVGVAALGAVRYGGSGAPALVAGLADVPVLPVNPVVARASALLGVMMIGWGVAGAQWMRSANSMSERTWRLLGAVLMAAVLVAATSIGGAYRASAMPAAMSLAAILPMAVVMGRRAATLRHAVPEKAAP